MTIEFKYDSKNYNIEIINPYYLPQTLDYPSEFDYTIGEVLIDGERQEVFAPHAHLEQFISDLVYTRLEENE